MSYALRFHASYRNIWSNVSCVFFHARTTPFIVKLTHMIATFCPNIGVSQDKRSMKIPSYCRKLVQDFKLNENN